MRLRIHTALLASAAMLCSLFMTGFSVSEDRGQPLEAAGLENTGGREGAASSRLDDVTDTAADETRERVQAAAEEREKIWLEEEAKNSRDKELLAALIFCEAGNQPYEGQVAVGAVVLNRVQSGTYPDSISEVIYQSGQFGPAMTGWLDRVLASGGYTNAALQAAEDALSGVNPIGECLYFGCGSYGVRIGDHYFH